MTTTRDNFSSLAKELKRARVRRSIHSLTDYSPTGQPLVGLFGNNYGGHHEVSPRLEKSPGVGAPERPTPFTKLADMFPRKR